MQPLRTSVSQLEAAIAVDDLLAFARAFTALVDRVGVTSAKSIVAALIAQQRPAPRRPPVPGPVTCA